MFSVSGDASFGAVRGKVSRERMQDVAKEGLRALDRSGPAWESEARGAGS